MSLNNDGIMVILSSPSGAGKTTLVKLLSRSRDFYTSISHTTRKARNNEEEGKDYYFINNDQFQNLIKKNEFLELENISPRFVNMVAKEQGKMFILSSPSGVGKTTLTKKIAANNKNFVISISHTTRKPRPTEINGKDYHFVSKDKFNCITYS